MFNVQRGPGRAGGGGQRGAKKAKMVCGANRGYWTMMGDSVDCKKGKKWQQKYYETLSLIRQCLFEYFFLNAIFLEWDYSISGIIFPAD